MIRAPRGLRRSAALALTLALVASPAAAPAAAAPTSGPISGPISGRGFDALPVGALPAVMAALGSVDAKLAARGAGALVELRNEDHGISALAGATGLRIGTAAGSLVLSPVALDRGDTTVALPDPGLPVADGNRVTTERGLLAEWLINAPAGIEQGFTVHADPLPGVPGALALALDLGGDLAANATLAAPTRLAITGTALAWDGLAAWDATGRVLPARMELAGTRLRLVVEDAGAAYPLTIDPVWVRQEELSLDPLRSNVFGVSVGISGDTIVVGASGDDSSATGVDGDELDTGADISGAAFVFVRSGGTWTRQAYLKASNTGAGDRFGIAVAIDGDTIVVGARSEDSSATGVDGDGTDDSASSAGAVYVFARSGTTWSQQAYLKASDTDAGDSFGEAVSVSGATVAVGAPGEDSASTGVDGDAADDSAASAGAVYVFVRSGTTWSQQAYVKASNAGTMDRFGEEALVVRGDTLVAGAAGEDSGATGVDGNAADESASGAGAAYVFVRSGTTWSQQAYLKASNTGAGDSFGTSAALSGATVVIGAYQEDSGASGVNGNQADDSASASGAAYVFTRSGTSWSQQAYLKAGNTGADDLFGSSAALSGDILVVGAWGEDGGSGGVNGDGTDDPVQGAGAAYVFLRSGTTWTQQTYLKADAPQSEAWFGTAVDISGDTVVVGAHRTDRGTDPVFPDAGIVTVYVPDIVPPEIGRVRLRPGTPEAGTRVRIRATVTDAGRVASAQVRIGNRRPLPLQGVRGDGRIVQPVRGTILLPAAGRQRICVRAIDESGNRSGWRCST
ncbi:MAG: hypothetical protein ACKOTZ_12170, partial [Chloroflexota bacterium]